MQVSQGGPGEAFDDLNKTLQFIDALNLLTEDITPRSGLDAVERRRKVGTLLWMVWDKYRSSAVTDAPVDLVDQLYSCAIQLVQLAHNFADIPPIRDITIGNMSEEAENSLRLLKEFGRWDQVAVRTTTTTDINYEICQPLEALQGTLVRRARDLGMSWRRIGEAVGMSAQGIQQKAQDRGWMSGSTAAGDD